MLILSKRNDKCNRFYRLEEIHKILCRKRFYQNGNMKKAAFLGRLKIYSLIRTN